MQSTITIKNLIRKLHIGCTTEEQATSQEIVFQINLDLETEPNACHSDNIKDTLDVRILIQSIERVCSQPPFNTLERLAKSIEDEFRFIANENGSSFKIDTNCSLTIEKPKFNWQYTHRWNQTF